MPRRSATGVSQSIDHFLRVAALDRKPATVEFYAKCLKPLRSLCKPADQVTADDLREIYADLRNRQTRFDGHPFKKVTPGGLSPWTLRKYIVAWKAFFNWCASEGFIDASPAAKLKRPKLPQIPPKDMTPEDLERMLREARNGSARDYALVCLLADSAARVGGIASLTLDRLDLAGHRAIVVEKGDKARVIHFKDRTELALMRYVEDERGALADQLARLDRPSGSYVFLGTKGPLTPGGIYQILKRLSRRAKVTGRYNPHSMRHAWARQAIKSGASLEEIRRVLGHSSIAVTAEFYAVFYSDEIAASHARYSWLPDEQKSKEAT